MHTLAETNISLEPAWAAVLVALLALSSTIVFACFAALAWYIRATVTTGISGLKDELRAEISQAVADAAAARANSDATLRNQVLWMDNAHTVDGDKIRRPPEDQ